MNRQRPGALFLAPRCYHPVSRRKDVDLRGRRARDFDAALARCDQTRADPKRYPEPPGHVHQLRCRSERRNVAEKMKKEKKQYIDGVNNLPYWKGETDHSARNHIFYYCESKLTAVRMGPYKFHFSTKEDYYANVVPRMVPLVFNLRLDAFESYDSKDSYSHLIQKVSWLIQPMGELMATHLKSLAEYPPVQGGNLNAILAGYMDFGLTQSDKLYMAVNGLAEWKERGPQAELRSVFSLYRETFREVFNDKDSKKICPKYPIFNLCNHDLTDFN